MASRASRCIQRWLKPGIAERSDLSIGVGNRMVNRKIRHALPNLRGFPCTYIPILLPKEPKRL